MILTKKQKDKIMLINLSNHPHKSKWDHTQLNAANQQFGEIEDIQFPNIQPDWDVAQIETLAREYYEQIKTKENTTKEKPVIHITGELVFCFSLIQMLLKDGFRCITSTTERIVKEENNEKTTVFMFKKFRDYKLLS